MKIVLDLEANSLISPTHIWVIVCKNIDTGELHIFRKVTEDEEEKVRFLDFASRVELWVGHNFLEYDYPIINRLLGLDIVGVADKSIDTLIVSRLVDYSRAGGHSIEQYGLEAGLEKGKFSDWKQYSQEMEDYCVRDVHICHKVYQKYLRYIEKHTSAISLEHHFQLVVNSLHNNGFAFNTTKARKLLDTVTKELAILDKEILIAFPPREVVIREFSPKLTKHGTISRSSIPRALLGDIHLYKVGDTYKHTKLVDFNPASHKQIIQVLNEAGWKPTDKTQTHIDTERELNRLKRSRDRDSAFDITLSNVIMKLENGKKVGWKVNENNLGSLIDKTQCLIRISKEEELGLESTIKDLKFVLKEMRDGNCDIKPTKNLEINHVRNPWNITIKIQDALKTNNSVKITECLLAILKRCLKDKEDAAEFVEKESFLWSITIMPQATFVDCSASFVTDTSAGTKDLTLKRQNILKELNNSFYEAPPPARTLARRILLESRRRTLTEWLGLVQEDSRIHGKYLGIGAWTHRMAHQKPNTANIPNEFDTQGKKKLLGKEMRSLWCAPRNRLLVGVDAEGIQLRIFAHYIDDKEFSDALVNGKKSDGSDPHSFNQRVLGTVCKTRAAAKRFIYALLLGAGIGKLGEILEVSRDEAQAALDRLMERYGGFTHLKTTLLPRDGRNGYFVGLDGRHVKLPGETASERTHLAMSGYLQNGEAIIIKQAALLALPRLPSRVYFVNLVHDEYQLEVPNDMNLAIEVGQLLADCIREAGEIYQLKCALAGSYWNDDLNDYTIATNWAYTH